MATLVWFRDDLRLTDHAALSAGAADPGGVVLLYLLDEASRETRPLGGAARWWLHHSLLALQADLATRGVSLILRRGSARNVIPSLIAEAGITRVLWNRRYGNERYIDTQIMQDLREFGVEAQSFQGSLLHQPGTIRTQAGDPYRVYSAFWRACLAAPTPAAPIPAPDNLQAAPAQPKSDVLEDWELLPISPNWASEFGDHWEPGEVGGARRLERFLLHRFHDYATARDAPALDATSLLSPHLRWGEISPRTVWHRALNAGGDLGSFLSEIGWREFAWHTLFQFGALHERPLDTRFEAFPWREADQAQLTAWREGRTGFGIVDAGMRELWRTGFMHNRVRMVVASFLTKNLLFDWRIGEAWFWDTLVDADAASNPFNWQWVAGCGADAAPYFRIFNPETQQQKFDPDGEYVARWAPETLLHTRIIDLKATRVRALAAYDTVRG